MPDHNRSTEVTPAAEALARPDTEIVPAVGEADDWMDFEPVLEKASVKRVFVVAIVGHGRKHDATLAAYRQAARKNAAPAASAAAVPAASPAVRAPAGPDHTSAPE